MAWLGVGVGVGLGLGPGVGVGVGVGVAVALNVLAYLPRTCRSRERVPWLSPQVVSKGDPAKGDARNLFKYDAIIEPAKTDSFGTPIPAVVEEVTVLALTRTRTRTRTRTSTPTPTPTPIPTQPEP